LIFCLVILHLIGIPSVPYCETGNTKTFLIFVPILLKNKYNSFCEPRNEFINFWIFENIWSFIMNNDHRKRNITFDYTTAKFIINIVQSELLFYLLIVLLMFGLVSLFWAIIFIYIYPEFIGSAPVTTIFLQFEILINVFIGQFITSRKDYTAPVRTYRRFIQHMNEWIDEIQISKSKDRKVMELLDKLAEKVYSLFKKYKENLYDKEERREILEGIHSLKLQIMKKREDNLYDTYWAKIDEVIQYFDFTSNIREIDGFQFLLKTLVIFYLFIGAPIKNIMSSENIYVGMFITIVTGIAYTSTYIIDLYLSNPFDSKRPFETANHEEWTNDMRNRIKNISISEAKFY